MANYFLKLLFLSGKYLTQNAERGLLQISLKSAEVQSQWSRHYQNAIGIVDPEENVLELLNSRLRELDSFACEKPLQATKQCSTSSLALSDSSVKFPTSEKAVQTSEIPDDCKQVGDVKKLNVAMSYIVNREMNLLDLDKANFKFPVAHYGNNFLPVNTMKSLGINSNRVLKDLNDATYQEPPSYSFPIPQQPPPTDLAPLMFPLLLELYYKIKQLNASITHFKAVITSEDSYRESSDNTSDAKFSEKRPKLYRIKVYSEKFPFNINSTFHRIAAPNIGDFFNRAELNSNVTVLSTVKDSEEEKNKRLLPLRIPLQQIKLFSNKFPYHINSFLHHAAIYTGANSPAIVLLEGKDDIKERTDILEINRKVFEDMEHNMKTVKLIEQVENDEVTQEEISGDFDGSSDGKSHFVASPEVTASTAVSRFEINRNGLASDIVNVLQDLIGNIAIYQPMLFTIALPLTNNNYNIFKRKDLYFQNIFSRYKRSAFERDDIIMTRSNSLHAISKHVQTQNDIIPLLHSVNHRNDSITEMLKKPVWTPPDIQTIYVNNRVRVNHLESNNIISALMLKLEESNSCLRLIENEQKRLFMQLCQQLTQTNQIMKKNVINVLENIPKNPLKTLVAKEVPKSPEESDEEIFKVRRIYNELPFYFGRQRIITMLSILPQTTLWNNQPKLPVDVSAKGLAKQMKSRFPFSKKYRYETKEVRSTNGDKIRITRLIVDNNLDVS